MGVTLNRVVWVGLKGAFAWTLEGDVYLAYYPVAQWQRIRLPMQEMQETWVQCLGLEEPLE